MVFINYTRYKEAIAHISKSWKEGCTCGVCKAVDNREPIMFKTRPVRLKVGH
jgi:hypothetical protein